MKKQIDFNSVKETRMEEKITNTMQREFPLPDAVNAATNKAFAKIRMEQQRNEFEQRAQENSRSAGDAAIRGGVKRRLNTIFTKSAAGLTAAAAMLTVVGVANPALAARIPLVGHVFEKIGNTLGYSGDYSRYAKPLSEETTLTETVGEAQSTEAAGDAVSVAPEQAAGVYTQTSNGVTVTLSEVYCNDAALSIAMLIHSEEAFPETMARGDNPDSRSISFAEPKLKFSYNDAENLVLSGVNASVDGEMIDEHTFAGVYRIPLDETDSNEAEWERYWADCVAFYKEKGVAVSEDGNIDLDSFEEVLGITTMWNDDIVSVGGPDQSDYDLDLEIPDSFSVDIGFTTIYGYLPEEQWNTPEISQELVDEYNAKLAEHGLDIENYENFTDEEKELERQFYTEQMQQFEAQYPTYDQTPNEYTNWTMDGEWQFHLDVVKNDADVETKEINDADENGYGIVKVTKTPFELTVEPLKAEDTWVVAFDAQGALLETHGTTSSNMFNFATGGHDLSKADIYVCSMEDYLENKGYYWSDDYEEKSKTKTYQQVIEEIALHHTEVTFEE